MGFFFFTWTLPLSVYGWCWYYTTALSMSMATEANPVSSPSSLAASFSSVTSTSGGSTMFFLSLLHNKTLVLGILLVLVVMNRSRLFGIALSKVLNLQLPRNGQLHVSVRHMLCRQLMFLQIEIACSKDPKWRISLSKVTIHSYLMAFFRSFGQKKILLIEIDELRVQLDDVQVDTLLRPPKACTKNVERHATTQHYNHQHKQQQHQHQQQPSSNATTDHNSSNMLGFLRFVDVLLNRIQVETQCVGAQIRCECSNLSLGILDVLVNKNLLHFQVTSSLLRVQITTANPPTGPNSAGRGGVVVVGGGGSGSGSGGGSSSSSNSRGDGDGDGGGGGSGGGGSTTGSDSHHHDWFVNKLDDTSREIISEGLLWEVPKLCAILDVVLKHKRPQDVVACRMYGSMEEMAHLQVCSSFLDFVMEKGDELMELGLWTGPQNSPPRDSKRASASDTTKRCSSSPHHSPTHTPKKNMSLELADFRLRFILVIEKESLHVPFQMTAELLKWSLTTKGTDDHESLVAQSGAMIGLDENPSLVGECNSNESQLHESPGSLLVHGIIHNVTSHVGLDTLQQFFTVSSIELRAVKRVVSPHDLDLQTGEIVVTLNQKMLQVCSSLDSIMTDLRLAEERWSSPYDSTLPGESELRAKLKHEKKWHIRLRSISWRSRICLLSSDPACKEQLMVYGLNSQVHSTFVNGNNTKTHVEVSQLSADVTLPISKDKTSLLFFHVDITTGKRHAVMTKEFFFRMKFKSCSVNSFENDSFAPRKRLPAARFTGVDIESVEMTAAEDGSLVSETNVSIIDTDVQWSHQDHRSMITETIAVVKFLDRVRVRLTPASKSTSSPTIPDNSTTPASESSTSNVVREQHTKKSDLCIRSKNASVRIEDIQDVSASALVTLTDGKLQFLKQPQLETNFVTASFIRVHLKEFLQPLVEISSFASVQKTICGPHRRFAKVPVNMEVTMLEAHVDLRPKCRLLLFCLQMQELLNFEQPKDAHKSRNYDTSGASYLSSSSNLGSVADISKELETYSHLSDDLNGEDSRHGDHEHKRLADLRGITLNCANLSLQISEKEEELSGSGPAPGSPRSRRISIPNPTTIFGSPTNEDDPDLSKKTSPAMVSYLLEMIKLDLKATISKSFELPEAVFQFLQHIKRDEATFFLPQSIEHVLGVEGTMTVDSMSVTRQNRTFATFSKLDMRFSVTDIARNDLIRPDDALLATSSPFMRWMFPARMNIYEISVSSESADILAEYHLLCGAWQLFPVVMGALDTTMRHVTNSNKSSSSDRDPSSPSSSSSSTCWRFRQMGNLELSVKALKVSVPLQQKLGKAPTWSCYDMTSYNKVIVFELKRTSLMQRQYQKISLDFTKMKCQLDDFDEKKTTKPMSMDVGEVTEVSEETIDGLSNKMLLLSLPHTQLDAVIDWKEDSVLVPLDCEAYAITFYLTLQSTIPTPTPASSAKSPTRFFTGDHLQYPSLEDAFLCLNWDWIYPFLMSLSLVNASKQSSERMSMVPVPSAHGDGGGAWICTGIQWHVNLEFVQIAWWDGGSFEAALLFVVRDLLVHGMMKKAVPIKYSRPKASNSAMATSAKELPSIRVQEDSVALAPEWVTPEMTLYMEGLRVYLLPDELDFSSVSAFQLAQSCRIGVIPFQFSETEDFFMELLGISYRFVYARPLDPVAGTSIFNLKDLAMDFCESPNVWMERIHASFLPVTCNFSISSSFSRATSVFAPEVFTVASSATKASSPVASHAQKKLHKLKRRSSEDSTCPIQIEAMKLLWTIGTRNSMAYMCLVILDDMQSLADMRGHFVKSQTVRVQAGQSMNATGGCLSTNSNVVDIPTSVSRLDVSVVSPPEPVRVANRPIRRDTLLDLLNQGKLGKTKGGSPKRSDASKHVPSPSRHRRGLSESAGEDRDGGVDCRAIHVKRYTFDVHDAQINLHDDNSKSNVLVVSRHFHLEMGRDALNTTNIVQMTLDNVSIHVAPIDVDLSVGVLWYTDPTRQRTTTLSPNFASGSPNAPSSSSAPSGSLLKQVMEECSLTCMYAHAIANDAIEVESELSFMNLSTDRHQFFQLFNIVRHVILSPPPSFLKRSKRTKTSVAPTPQGSSSISSSPSAFKQDLLRGASKDDCLQSDNPKSTIVDPTSAADNTTAALYANNPKKLHAMLMEKMQSQEAKMANTYRASTPMAIQSLSFKAIGCKWRFRTSPETMNSADHEFVEFRIQNLSGCHIFYEDKCTKLTMNIQWMEINNLRPGASSIAFEDAMAVLKPQLLFARHGLQSMAPSGPELQEILSLNHMLSIRAESGPVTKVLGQKLRVLDVLEISIFPEVPYMIVIQMAVDFYELMYKFFFEHSAVATPVSGGTSMGSESENGEQVLFGRKTLVVNASPPKHSPTKHAPAPSSAANTNPSNTMVPAASARPLVHELTRRRSLSLAPNTTRLASKARSGGGQSSAGRSADGGSTAGDEEDNSAHEGEELLYFKYVRIGNICLRINCNGFFVNLSNFDLDLPSYVCQSKLCTWKKLLGKFESHLKWYVTKESASSGLSQFKNKFLKWQAPGVSLSASTFGPSALVSTQSPFVGGIGGGNGSGDDKKLDEHQEEEDNFAKAKMLFGPYHTTEDKKNKA